MVREPLEHIENYMDSEKSKNRAFLRVWRLYGTFWEKRGGGDGGIRTLDTRSRYGSLAGNWFQPLTHVSAATCQAV